MSTHAHLPRRAAAAPVQRSVDAEEPVTGRGPVPVAGLAVGSSRPLQRKSQEQDPADRLPAALRRGIEELSGLTLDDVRVHRNSAEPARLAASAFSRGTDIHLSPGAGNELAHEAWHVVQQRQGRVPSTGSVGGQSLNDDPALEREADQMGARAAHQAGLPELAPDVGREPAPAPAAVTGVAGGTPLQARWLFLDADSATNKGYFWEPETGVNETDVPAPTRWSAEHRRVGQPAETEYYREGAVSSRAATRGRSPALDEAQFTQKYGQPRAPSTSDHYNPYGRFSATASALAFLPHVTFKDKDAFLADLLRRDPKFQAIAQLGPLNPSGVPMQVKTTAGHVLELVDVNQLGALYADAVREPQKATATRAASSTAGLGLTAAPAEAVTHRVPGSGGGVSAVSAKVVLASRIDTAVLAAWHGKKRSKDQAQVMGCSAGEAAANAGYDPAAGLGWEWLHLISHGMGGPDGTGPQHSGNLVVGTSECNSQMIVVEEVLKDLVQRYNLTATLAVFANICDPARHISDRIVYDFYFSEPGGKRAQVFHWDFNPLSRDNPLVAENLLARIVARHHLGDTTDYSRPTVPRATASKEESKEPRKMDEDEDAA